MRCLEERMAVFSPHTSWDAVPGGINSWLVEPYGPGEAAPLSLSSAPHQPGHCSHSVSVSGLPVATDQLQGLLAIQVSQLVTQTVTAVFQGIEVNVDSCAVTVACPESKLPLVLEALPAQLREVARVTKLEKHPLPGHPRSPH